MMEVAIETNSPTIFATWIDASLSPAQDLKTTILYFTQNIYTSRILISKLYIKVSRYKCVFSKLIQYVGNLML